MIAYSDASWIGCPDSLRHVIGWCMFLSSTLIPWKRKKQEIVFKSSTKFEYHVLSTACYEIIWLRGLLDELEFSQNDSMPFYVDNTSVIQIVANPIFHERTKYIKVDVVLSGWIMTIMLSLYLVSTPNFKL